MTEEVGNLQFGLVFLVVVFILQPHIFRTLEVSYLYYIPSYTRQWWWGILFKTKNMTPSVCVLADRIKPVILEYIRPTGLWYGDLQPNRLNDALSIWIILPLAYTTCSICKLNIRIVYFTYIRIREDWMDKYTVITLNFRIRVREGVFEKAGVQYGQLD